MTDRHALPRAAGSIRLIGVKKNHRLSRWVAFAYLAIYVLYIEGYINVYDTIGICRRWHNHQRNDNHNLNLDLFHLLI